MSNRGNIIENYSKKLLIERIKIKIVSSTIRHSPKRIPRGMTSAGFSSEAVEACVRVTDGLHPEGVRRGCVVLGRGTALLRRIAAYTDPEEPLQLQ